MSKRAQFRPFEARGRLPIIAILTTFALFSTITIALSVRTTSRSQNRAVVIEVAARQRTLAERYVSEVLLRQRGLQADPSATASVLARSARALLDGGAVPAVNGDDDETSIASASGRVLRDQIAEEQRLITDLTHTGQKMLAGRDGVVALSGHEHLGSARPIQRLRVIGALTSNVSLNVARTLANADDRNISSLLVLQVGFGVGGLLLSLLLAWALISATRRQTGHFRSLITSSSELVLVLSGEGCRYASQSVVTLLATPESDLLGGGINRFVHDEDRALVAEAAQTGGPARFLFRLRNAAGEWRHLDAHLTDRRHDRHIQGVVINARDITERVRLELELTEQARRDTFSGQLVEALEMADDETAAYEVVERAMVEVDAAAPMELLLSDSSRAHLERVAISSTAGAPSCPVESPFSCVAVRRGNPVVFESSDALNACPKLRDRSAGACSAVCVPISFMGRAMGVLHSTGPNNQPPNREQVAQLTTLATQAGTRIGTVRAFERTQLQAATDTLTGLDNRRTAERHLRTLTTQNRPFALALADLDHFKQLNDKHGHEAGDRALKLFAQLATQTIRDHDLIGRWGGEEFMIIFPDSDQTQALDIIERLRAKLATTHTGEHPRFTASFGITDSNHAQTQKQLIHTADLALYAAKQNGRDQAQLSTPTDNPAAQPPNNQTNPQPAKLHPLRKTPALHQSATDDDPTLVGLELR